MRPKRKARGPNGKVPRLGVRDEFFQPAIQKVLEKWIGRVRVRMMVSIFRTLSLLSSGSRGTQAMKDDPDFRRVWAENWMRCYLAHPGFVAELLHAIEEDRDRPRSILDEMMDAADYSPETYRREKKANRGAVGLVLSDAQAAEVAGRFIRVEPSADNVRKRLGEEGRARQKIWDTWRKRALREDREDTKS